MESLVTVKAAELQEQGYCILKRHFPVTLIDDCHTAFLPVLEKYLAQCDHLPNRGTNRHFLPMPFDPPSFDPKFFFDEKILSIVKIILGERIVADQLGCDVPLSGSGYQTIHADYQRPLFPELPDLQLPAYMLVMSIALTNITVENGAIELAPATHRMSRQAALKTIEQDEITMVPICLNIGDVLIRNPWVLHRGTPNKTDTPRLLSTIRYVRNWYADGSREVNSIPALVWDDLTSAQQNMLRFPRKID